MYSLETIEKLNRKQAIKERNDYMQIAFAYKTNGVKEKKHKEIKKELNKIR